MQFHANFRGFPSRVRQTRAVDVVGKGLQAVVCTTDNKCVTQLVAEMTTFGKLNIRRVDLLHIPVPCVLHIAALVAYSPY